MTGMFLDLKLEEILSIIENEAEYRAKVTEAQNLMHPA